MKKNISILLLVTILSTMLFSCTSKTPDVVASEEAAALTLDTIDWSLEVEGADVDAYTLADAKKHDISKIICSMMIATDQNSFNFGQILTSFICEGITLHELLEDVGRADATKVTYYGQIITFKGPQKFYEDTSFEITGDLLKSDDVLIGWISNKTEILPDSESYVGVFAASSVTDFASCCSVTKIVIE